jgi:hypothetical protein
MGCSGSKPNIPRTDVATTNLDYDPSKCREGSIADQSTENLDRPESAHVAGVSTRSNSPLTPTSPTAASMSHVAESQTPEALSEGLTSFENQPNAKPLEEHSTMPASVANRLVHGPLSSDSVTSPRKSVSFDHDIQQNTSHGIEKQRLIVEQQQRLIEQQQLQLEKQQKALELQQQKEIDLWRKAETERRKQTKPPRSPPDQKEYVAHNNPPRPSIVLPNDPSFTCSINGRNDYKHTDVYTIGTSDEDVLGEGSFGKVFRAKHKFGQSEFEEHSGEEDDDEGNPDVVAKKKVLFGPYAASSSGGVGHNDLNQGRSRKSRHNPLEEWKGYVAIKTTKPTALDTKGGRQIRSYDDVESYCAEIKMLIRLRGENARSSPCLFLYEYFFNNRSELQVVTELLGQELDQWRNNHVTFLESDAMAAAKQILLGIEFMQSRDVVRKFMQ